MAATQEIYEAFGRGDVVSILERLADDIQWDEWADSFAQRAGVPWVKARHGRDGVADFFTVVGGFQISHFEVRSIMAGDSQVAVEVEIEATVQGGGRYRDQELHLWTFGADGKVVRMRHYTDTAKHIAAAQGKDTTASR
jgi:ketosteroid isomerase-like protein